MKRKTHILIIALILSGILAGILICSAIFALTGFSLFSWAPEECESAGTQQDAELVVLAYRVLENIRDGDFYALSQVVHPEFGVVFTPGATINLVTDRRFGAEQIAALGANEEDEEIYIWGVHNDSGEPIELTPSGYIEQYVSAGDFLEASVIGVNQVIRSGNALENITDVFPDVVFVDFYLSVNGKESHEEHDWSSLRLGFEEYKGELRLIVIVHSRWTP